MKPLPNDVRIHNALLSCKTVYDEKQALLRLRANESFEIALIVSGTGIHHVLDKDIPCAQGDIFIIPPNTPHGYFVETADAQMSVRQLFFFVEDWFVSDVANSLSRRFCYGAFRESQTLGYAVLNSRMQEKIQSIWELTVEKNAPESCTEKFRDPCGLISAGLSLQQLEVGFQFLARD